METIIFSPLKVEEKTRLPPKYLDQLFLDSLAIFHTKYGNTVINLGGADQKLVYPCYFSTIFI